MLLLPFSSLSDKKNIVQVKNNDILLQLFSGSFRPFQTHLVFTKISLELMVFNNNVVELRRGERRLFPLNLPFKSS